jgi:signal transduction histidine kinase
MIDALVQMLQRILTQADVSVTVGIAPRLPELWGDQVQLQQVLLNLLVNAIDAMRNQGGRARRIVVEVREHTVGSILFSVEDSGPGVPTEIAASIFEPFHSTKSDGLGMGLAISRTIVENHGGTLWLDASSAEGSRFAFRIPVQSP